MSKIKLLVIPSDRTGVGKFRSIDPHIFLNNLYPDDFHVDIVFEVDYNNISFWKEYQIIHFHRSIGQDMDRSADFIPTLKSMGIITICDIDDYWMPTKEHPLHQLIVQNKISEKIIANIKLADYVTTTTELYAAEIMKYNKNVVVFPKILW